MALRVKEIYERTGVDRETLRFYEKKALLPIPARTSAGYRQFPEEILERIDFIKTAKEVGFTLNEIKELIDLKKKPVDCKNGSEIAQRKKEEVLSKIESMKKIVSHLDQFISGCSNEVERGEGRSCNLSFGKGCG